MGRPLGGLRGRTGQADELAVWLRKVTMGKAVRTLAHDFAYSTTSWSEFRSGSRLPPEELLEAVVERYVGEPRMRERQLAEGLRLLAAARRAEAALGGTNTPAPAPLPVPVQRGTDVVTQALLRLDDARLRQIEALEKLASSERRRAQLEDMVSVLQERCTVLEVERDRAREDVRAELESELQISREYRLQADEKLEHARRAEEKAYQLRLAAEQQVARERIALNHIDEETTDSAPHPSATKTEDLGLPPLEQIRDVLQAAQEQLEVQDDELDDLEELIGLDPTPQDTPLTGRAPRTAPEQPDDYPEPDLRAAAGGKAAPVGREQSGNSQGPDPVVVPEQPRDNPQDPPVGQRPVPTPPDIPSPPPKGYKKTLVQQLIETATTPEDLEAALQELRQRAGGTETWPITAEGRKIPGDWNQLKRILTSLNATETEYLAFATAHREISSNYPPERGTLPMSLPVPQPLSLRVRDIAAPALGIPSTALVATSWFAALHADPGPAILKMTVYGLGAAVLALATWAVPFGITIKQEKKHLRDGPGMAAFFGPPIALVLGAVAPFVGLDVVGAWTASLIALM
ncbi:hypothetical protein [Streptomyces sp. NPDC058622]|uniref:hypothetical protein n=1 Tax=Streptomyces sp. NPDC058622 TaxID=3346562 RepID=UPI00365C3D2A